MEHIFTINIKNILQRNFSGNAVEIFEKSQLIQYINEKTRSAGRGSKARSSFANLYAIYVIIEDYIVNGFDEKDDYSKYEGASFHKLLARQRELPFGSKLQNHALNNRVNSEFEKYFLTSDERLFEIVSYSILKYYYHDQTIWGYEMDKLNTENLKLYKTGRTNANDGGIDFVMKPLGKFFQVTETLDFKKYFLDIDKIQKYPITFVIKSDEDVENLTKKIQENANKTYSIGSIVAKYMACIEEVINIPILNIPFKEAVQKGYLNQILDEIVLQSKVEFN